MCSRGEKLLEIGYRDSDLVTLLSIGKIQLFFLFLKFLLELGDLCSPFFIFSHAIFSKIGDVGEFLGRTKLISVMED